MITKNGKFNGPAETMPGAGAKAMETYEPTRLTMDEWALWRNQVVDLVLRLHPDHGVLARASAGALCEVIRLVKPSRTESLADLLTDDNLGAAINHSQRRGLTAPSSNGLRIHLEGAQRVARGFEKHVPTPAIIGIAPLGRIAVLESLKDSEDSFLRTVSVAMLNDLAEIKTEPWENPVEANIWTKFTKQVRKLGYNGVRWRWAEVKNERIRQEFIKARPSIEIVKLVDAGPGLQLLIAGSLVPDVQDFARLIRGSANMVTSSWFIGNEMMLTSTHSSLPAVNSKKHSKALAKRLAAQARHQQVSAPQPLSVKLENILTQWSPRFISDEDWEQSKDLVHEIMRRCRHIRGPESFTKHLRLVTNFINWTRKAGYDQDFQTVLTEEAIDDFQRRGSEHKGSTQATYRSDLRNIARNVNTGAGAPTKALAIAHETVKPPYTTMEVRKLLHLIELQQNSLIKRRIKVAFALGLGAGLSARDIQQMSRADIEDLGQEGLQITVRGDRPRKLFLRYEYEDLLRDGLNGLTRNEHVLGRRNMGKDTLVDLYRPVQPLGDGPEFLQGRMRNTWLAVLMCEPIPLWTILEASGLIGARTLTDIAQFLQPEVSAHLVRGEAA